jgi:hypothetical protein
MSFLEQKTQLKTQVRSYQSKRHTDLNPWMTLILANFAKYLHDVHD